MPEHSKCVIHSHWNGRGSIFNVMRVRGVGGLGMGMGGGWGGV